MASKPGKYAHLTPDLPRMSTVEPERRGVVDIIKAEILAPVPEDEQYPPSLIHDNLAEMGDTVENLITLLKCATNNKHHSAEFARIYTEVRKVKDKIAEWGSDVQLILEAYTELMIEQMEKEGISSQRLINGNSVSVYLEPYPQVKDKEAYRQWCIKQGLEKEMHLWPSKTASLVKEMLLAGDPEPPGVEVYSVPKVRLNT